MENKQRVLEGLWEGGQAKWVRDTKESTSEIIVHYMLTNLDVN